MLVRNSQKIERGERNILEAWSNDGGLSWSPFTATSLPNPNSGIDGLVLKDGRALLVYNDSVEGRDRLSLALSNDGGHTWSHLFDLENERGSEFSYPAVIQTSDGMVHVTYTWKRRKIRHVVIDILGFVP